MDKGKNNKISNKDEYGIDGSKENKNEEILRITVSKLGQDALTAIVDRVNDGFIGGKINRTQIANWIMVRFNEKLSDAEVKEIRVEHFDEVAALEAILRRAKELGKVPTDFKSLLQKQFENIDQKKRTKKVLVETIVNGGVG
jgi:hypothetical protein